jgi:hypothetical protein
MEHNNKDIDEFIEAWAEEFGEYLPKEEAIAEIDRLLEFFSKLDEEIHREK